MSKFDLFFDGARRYLYENPMQRRGQAYMNHLSGFDKNTFDMVHSTVRDPWDREDRFYDFLRFLRDLWAVK